jgi:two-component system KDP operon response regulator KdpE
MYHPRILIVDDEPEIIKLLQATFRASDFETLVAMDGAEAVQIIQSELPDLIILDIMMPKMNGFEVCRWLREWSKIPIIMLSALGDTGEKVKCLNLGADDYITKPFSQGELAARAKAVLRRSHTVATIPTQLFFSSGDLKINFATRHVTITDNEVKLTPMEFNLLKELAINAGKVLTHSHLLGKVWGAEYGGEKEYLRVFVNRLRTKLEPNPAKPRYIATVPGVGYMFNKSVPDRVQITGTTSINESRP